jgi:hypothetical protein
MDEPLTDAVLHAMMTAHGLVTIYSEWSNPEAPDSLGTMLEVLHGHVVASNDLVERVKEFRLIYPTIPDPVCGVSEASYHELGRTLAQKVSDGLWEAVNRSAMLHGIAGHVCGPKCAEKCPGRDFARVRENWPAVQLYLRHEAPRFDCGRLVACIRDEAGRSAARAEMARPSAPGEFEPSTPVSFTKEDLALALLSQHPDWSDTKIAETLGCARTSLYRWNKYTAAREIQSQEKHKFPRGSKFRGHIEAESE